MERLSVSWGQARRGIVHPIGAADRTRLLWALLAGAAGLSVRLSHAALAQLVGASLFAPGAVVARISQTHSMAMAADAASDLTADGLGAASGIDLGVSLSAQGEVLAMLQQAHRLSSVLFGGTSAGSELAQSHHLSAGLGAPALIDADITMASAEPAYSAAAIAYTGTGASQAITGLGFAPQLVIILRNGQTTVKCAIFDVATGPAKGWSPGSWGFPDNDTVAAWANSLTSFDTDGFTLGAASAKGGINVNASGVDYVALCIGAGTGAQTANFDVLSYTGDGENGRALSHDCATAPIWAWNKRHINIKSAEYIVDAGFNFDTVSLSGVFGATANSLSASDASEVEVGGAVRWNTGTNLTTLYLFGGEAVAGAFKTGTYTGSGVAGNAITGLGFAPSVVLVRSVTGSGTSLLAAALSGSTAYDLGTGSRNGTFALDADGFTVDGSGNINQSGVSYRYLAWA